MPGEKETGGTNDSPPGGDQVAQLQKQNEELAQAVKALETQLEESRLRSSGKDKTITEKSKELAAAQDQIAALDTTYQAELEKLKGEQKKILEAARTIKEAKDSQDTQLEALAAEVKAKQGQIARLTKITEAGIPPDLARFVPVSDNEEELERQITSLKEAEQKIKKQAMDELAQFVVVPGGAPQQKGPSDTGQVNLDEVFKGLRTTEDIVEASEKAAAMVEKMGLKDDGDSWMEKTRYPLED